MYGYKEFIPLTPEEILCRVSEEDIFSIIIKEEIIEDKGAFYKAPYRNDEIADCYFTRYDGHLRFIDFADYQRAKTCFGLLQRAYNISYREAMELINNHFKLGLGDNLEKTKEVVIENDCVEEEKIVKSFKERVITYLPRQFDYKDKQFWDKYGITKQNLIDDKVVPVEIYRSTNRKGETFTIRCFDICYAYTDFENNKVKIYRPHAITKEAKWFTNCSQNDVGSLQHLPQEGELLIISKSYKDCRVLRNMGLNSCWFQNEGMIPGTAIIEDLSKRFKKILVWFDNDSAGMTNSRIVIQYINSIHPDKAKNIMLPPRLLTEQIKDPSDFYASKGKEELIKFLTVKKLL